MPYFQTCSASGVGTIFWLGAHLLGRRKTPMPKFMFLLGFQPLYFGKMKKVYIFLKSKKKKRKIYLRAWGLSPSGTLRLQRLCVTIGLVVTTIFFNKPISPPAIIMSFGGGALILNLT